MNTEDKENKERLNEFISQKMNEQQEKEKKIKRLNELQLNFMNRNKHFSFDELVIVDKVFSFLEKYL